MSGLVLQGQIKPHECPAFGTRCTPEHPLGAPMVSGEGACAAYYRYRRHDPMKNARLNMSENRQISARPVRSQFRNTRTSCWRTAAAAS